MAIRNLIKAVTDRRGVSAAQQAPDLQVDFSYTQWRHAQMEQLVRNYHQACDTCEGAPA
jgi:hypothetical protein